MECGGGYCLAVANQKYQKMMIFDFEMKNLDQHLELSKNGWHHLTCFALLRHNQISLFIF
jgi:hypothetical protein